MGRYRALIRRHPVRTGLLLALPVLIGLLWPSLPDPLFPEPQSTVLFSREGLLLGARVAADGQWRFPPSQAPLPQRYLQALLLFEDRHFMHHPGVDPLALARAVWQNLTRGRRVSGASTLSMQVIRLARGPRARTLGEKFREILLALRLERRLTKQEVLRLYATHAPFGGNIVGLEAASWLLFHRAPQHLTWAESALLAVLPNAPSSLHIGRMRQPLLAKRNRLIQRLFRKGLMDQATCRMAQAEPLPPPNGSLPDLAPHLLDSLARQSSQTRLTSTLQIDLQRRLTDKMKSWSPILAGQGVPHAAALIVHNPSGEVLAQVGNTASRQGGASASWVDLSWAPRSSGSLLKPFLYGALLEQGQITPLSLMADVPIRIGAYSPENFDRLYQGALRADLALARSRNIPAVRELQMFGVAPFLALLRSWGVSTLSRNAEDYGLSLILGGGETCLVEMAGLYTLLAQKASTQTVLLPIHHLKGKPPRAPEAPGIGPGAAWLTLKALCNANRPGLDGYWRSFSSSSLLAFKTGTSFGLRDAWAIGVDPQVTIAVWAGDAEGNSIPGLNGLDTAAPVLMDLRGLLPPARRWFSPPGQDLRSVAVCSRSGWLPTPDCPTEEVLLPRHAHTTRFCPYHQALFLDPTGQYRVDSRWGSPTRMERRVLFILPPLVNYFLKDRSLASDPLPPWHPDLVPPGTAGDIQLIHPQPGSRIFLPVALDGVQEPLLLQAAHRIPEETIFWHLDGTYLGETRQFHTLLCQPEPGKHLLVLQDRRGNRLSRELTILDRSQPVAPATRP